MSFRVGRARVNGATVLREIPTGKRRQAGWGVGAGFFVHLPVSKTGVGSVTVSIRL